jgi:predicted RNase H-like nuclease (RuvC/YqgF family)|tara:strand:- start:1802 stop:2005 length:204 start_codon:yes stop_codon:yes gene_type:complete
MDNYRDQLQKQIDKTEQELYSLKRKLFKLDQRAKHEQYMRRRYPAVEEAYKQYQMMLKLVKTNKDNK